VAEQGIDLVFFRSSDGPQNVCVLEIPQSSYIHSIWDEVLSRRLKGKVRIMNSFQKNLISKNSRVFHYAEYDDLDFDKLGSADPKYLGCSYIYRKALIRKHYLSHTVRMYSAKNPDSVLKKAYPESYDIEVDYAEFLDDALDEAYELRSQVESGEHVWILKPSMSDRGQGIRLFKTIDQLQQIFSEFEEQGSVVTDSEDESGENYGVITSQLRHFVVQKYVENPLILSDHGDRKFHIRTYVLCVGAIKVYVYRDMLALFALHKYQPPVSDPNDGQVRLNGHLTNTCLQGEEKDNQSVDRFWNLKGISYEGKNYIFNQICDITGELFKAACTNDRINFQPVPNAFEFYGLDFLVQADNSVNLLEVNAYPDFKQTGDDLKDLIHRLLEATTNEAILPFFGLERKQATDLKIVLDQNLSGSW
jgi:tubulin--tyrosine ligase